MSSGEEILQQPLCDRLPDFSYNLYSKYFSIGADVSRSEKSTWAKNEANREVLSVLKNEQEIDDIIYLLYLLYGIDSRISASIRGIDTPLDDNFENIVCKGIDERAAENPGFLKLADQTLMDYFTSFRRGKGDPMRMMKVFSKIAETFAEHIAPSISSSAEPATPSQRLWDSVNSRIPAWAKAKATPQQSPKPQPPKTSSNAKTATRPPKRPSLSLKAGGKQSSREVFQNRKTEIFKKGIRLKDPSDLKEILGQIEHQGTSKYLGFEDKPEVQIRRALDLVGMIIEEMADEGFKNAQVLKERWFSPQTKEFDSSRVVIEIGKALTTRLNEYLAQEGNNDSLSSNLALGSAKDMLEAVRRISIALFELGGRPSNSQQKNYELSMSIASQIIRGEYKRQRIIKTQRVAALALKRGAEE